MIGQADSEELHAVCTIAQKALSNQITVNTVVQPPILTEGRFQQNLP